MSSQFWLEYLSTSVPGLPRWCRGKESACNAEDARDVALIPGSGKIPWRRKWQSTPVFLTGKFYGQRSLAGCSPWVTKSQTQLSTCARTHTHTHTHTHQFSQFSSFAQLCLILCDPMDCNMPGLPVHHQLLEFTQTHVHWVGDAIQPSHPLSSPSPLTFNLSQHQGLFQWVSSSRQVARVLEFQLQYRSFPWIFRTVGLTS